ncbi:hypothetical protein [Corynebacterium oculi]|nr:hypothetical protein [Corynebacterium oculi]
MRAAEIKAGFRDYLNRRWAQEPIMVETPEGLAVRDDELGLIPVAGSDAQWEEYWRGCSRADPHPFSLMAVHLDEALAIIEFREYQHPGIVAEPGGFHATQYVTLSQRAEKIKREFCAYVNESWFLREMGMAPGKNEEGGLIEQPQEIWVAGDPRIALVGSAADWVECASRHSGAEHSEYLLMLMALDEALDGIAERGEAPQAMRVSGAGFAAE